MTKLKFKKSIRACFIGDVIEIDDSLAAEWVAQGYADVYTDAALEGTATPSVDAPEVIPQSEYIAVPRGRPKGSKNR